MAASVIYAAMCFLASIVCEKAHFNVEELNLNHYTMQFSSEPVLQTEVNPSSLFMRSKYGQSFECNLPKAVLQLKEIEEGVSDEGKSLPELLKPMKSSSCLLFTRDWWTYEFCYGKAIKQYHYDEVKGITGPTMILGNYERDYDWNNTTNDKQSNRKLRYHSQFYNEGTNCDLTGKPRQTEVRFFCNKDAANHISRIDEPSSCQYIIEIQTNYICNHPNTKPAFKIVAQEISCSPVLTKEQFESYRQSQQEKKKIDEEKIKQWLEKETEKLNEMKEKSENPLGGSDNVDNLLDINNDDENSVLSDTSAGEEKEPEPIPDPTNVIDSDMKELIEETPELRTLYTKIKHLEKEIEEADEEDINILENDIKKSADEDQMESSSKKSTLSSLLKDLAHKNSVRQAFRKKRGNSEEDSSVSDKSYENDKSDKKTNAIKEKLSSGQKIQIKVVRVNDLKQFEQVGDDFDITLQETIQAYFKESGWQESVKQIVKQKETEKSYKFVWNKHPKVDEVKEEKK